MEQKFGPRRSRETTKPRCACPPLFFYACNVCGNMYQNLSGRKSASLACCNEVMQELPVLQAEDVRHAIHIDYKITGGYNENAVEVYWQICDPSMQVRWVYLRTFTGGMLKYAVHPEKHSFIFALADEDAYVYCDEDPCLECTFRCKRGFEIYIALNGNMLVCLPLEKMTAHWQS